MPFSEETTERLIQQIASANTKLTLIQDDIRKLPGLCEDMAVVKSQMLALLGNGQPGRISRLEENLAANEQRSHEQEQQLHSLIADQAEASAFFRGKLAGVAVLAGSLSGFLALICEAVKLLKRIR